MKIKHNHCTQDKKRAAFTLIEMIGVLAVIAIAAPFHRFSVYVNDIDPPPQRNPEVVAVLLCKLVGQFPW